MGVVIKTEGEIELMDEANAIVHRVLSGLEDRIKPGVTTLELDAWAESVIREAGGVPAFLNYRGFPATLCTSVNDVIVHGIPNGLSLQDGDIIGVDCGVQFKGYFGDAARTFRVGEVSAEADRLLEVTSTALDKAVDVARPGAGLHEIGAAVQEYVEAEGFSIVRDFTGHGIGTSLHEEPSVPNYRPKRSLRSGGMKLKRGMVLAIEPMVNVGAPGIKMDSDGWTARTSDGSLSAHFEFSVAVTAEGPRILGRKAA